MKWSNLLFLGGGGLLLWHFYDKERRFKEMAQATRRRLARESNPNIATPILPGKRPEPRSEVKKASWESAGVRPWLISGVIRAEPPYILESDWRRYRQQPFQTAWTQAIPDWFERDAYFPAKYPVAFNNFTTPKELMQSAWDSQLWTMTPETGSTPPNLVVLQPANQVTIPISEDFDEVRAAGGAEAYVEEMLNQIATFVARIRNENMAVVLIGPYPYGDAPYWGFENQVWWNQLESGMKEIARQSGAYYVNVADEFGEAGKFAEDEMGIPRAHLEGDFKNLVVPDWDLADEIGMSVAEAIEAAAKDSGLISGSNGGAVS